MQGWRAAADGRSGDAKAGRMADVVEFVVIMPENTSHNMLFIPASIFLEE